MDRDFDLRRLQECPTRSLTQRRRTRLAPYSLTFTFADGEWVKDILISAVDDDEHEAEEFLLAMIYDASRAEFNDSANRLTVCVTDNEEAIDE